ncbi:MAG: hypothetical protein ACTHLX_10065, partial [Candidatus Binatia bacterium]
RSLSHRALDKLLQATEHSATRLSRRFCHLAGHSLGQKQQARNGTFDYEWTDMNEALAEGSYEMAARINPPIVCPQRSAYRSLWRRFVRAQA